MSARLTKLSIDQYKTAQSDHFIWDADVKGFGIKIAKGGRKMYVCKYRVGNGRTAPTRRMTIEAHDSPWTVDQARTEAKRVLGRAAHGENPFVIAILKLLIFTGARKNEIEGLMWNEANFQTGYLQLVDSKTGQKVILLNAGALEILSKLTRQEGSEYVFPSFRDGLHYVGTPKVWTKIRALAGLDDVRLHDLRHSFASIAVSGGASLPIVGALLGHSDSATTQRYAQLGTVR